MKIPFIVDGKKVTLDLLTILCVLVAFIVSGCGDDYGSSGDGNNLSNTGSYACSIKWPEDVPTLESASIVSRAIDCDAAGVVTVAFTFYDGSGSYLTGDEWSCSLHEGTVDGIPVGTNRRLVVTGKDASGAMLYWGEETGITIVADQTTQGGEIEMEYVYGTVPSAPTNVAATAGDQQVTISWDTVTGATSYNIYWSTSQGVTTDTGTKISTFSSPYTHTGLTNDTAYYYVVTAENSYGESDDSGEVSAAPSAEGEAPPTPTNVSATAGDQEVTISWDTVSDATSYNIYWSTSQGVTTDTGTKIATFSSPYTHTGLTNGTAYYYVVTAENSYGESGESSEVSATPSAPAGPIPDSGQTQSYTDTFGEDSDYTINPPSYTDNGDGTVTDNVTGLMWQQEDDDTTRIWDDAVNYCNDLTLGGDSDWRLPSAMELMSIVDYGAYDPSIDTTYFSATNVSFYWSSSSESNSSEAWSVGFRAGSVNDISKSNDYYVRCIRGVEFITGDFTDNGDGTVTDSNTGLMWKQGEGEQKTWEDAITYCEDLSLAGYTDWRFPNIKELRSIVDDSLSYPAIDTNYFPDAHVSPYWSSTTHAKWSSDAWYVDFHGADVDPSANKSYDYYVRCVRGGQ